MIIIYYESLYNLLLLTYDAESIKFVVLSVQTNILS